MSAFRRPPDRLGPACLPVHRFAHPFLDQRGPNLGVTAHLGVVPTPRPEVVFPAASSEGQNAVGVFGPNLGVTAHSGVVPTPRPEVVFQRSPRRVRMRCLRPLEIRLVPQGDLLVQPKLAKAVCKFSLQVLVPGKKGGTPGNTAGLKRGS